MRISLGVVNNSNRRKGGGKAEKGCGSFGPTVVSKTPHICTARTTAVVRNTQR